MSNTVRNVLGFALAILLVSIAIRLLIIPVYDIETAGEYVYRVNRLTGEVWWAEKGQLAGVPVDFPTTEEEKQRVQTAVMKSRLDAIR